MQSTGSQAHGLHRWGGVAIAVAAALAAISCIPSSGPKTLLVRTGPTRVIGTLLVNAASGQERQAAREIELPDAKIYLLDARGGRAAEAVTWLDGRFEIIAPRPGRHRICYQIGAVQGCGPWIAARGGTVLAGPVTASTRGFIHGRALTRDGRPCWVSDTFFGLDVSTRVAAAPAGSGGPPQASARANVQGEYALFGLNPGRYDVTAECEAASVTGLASLGAGPAARDLTLPNHAPVLQTAAAFAGGRGVLRAAPGATVELRADAVDRDGDTIAYIWRTLDGSGQLAASGSSARWELAADEGLRSVYLIARDGRGGFAYRRIDIAGARNRRVGASGRAIDEATGGPVRNAAVTFGSANGSTNEEGWFQVESEPRDDGRYVLNIRHPNYALTSRVLERSARGDSYEMTPAQVEITPAGARIRLSDRTSGSLCGNPAVQRARSVVRRAQRRLRPSLSDRDRFPPSDERLAQLRAPDPPCMARGAEISVPAGALVDSLDAAAAGPVRTTVATLNPARRALPGDYSAIPRGGPRSALLTYGAVDVRFTDGRGRPLDLRDGAVAEVRIPVAEGQLADAPATMKMWSYEEETGRWIEEGRARLVRTAEGAFYVGRTRHFSAINMDIELNAAFATCVRFQVDAAFGSWAPLTLRAYVTYNGTQSQVAQTVLDSSTYHSIRALPYGPGNTLRLEISGTANNVTQVLLNDIIQIGPPETQGDDGGLFPPHPYLGCYDAGILSPPAEVIPFYGVDATGRPMFLTGPFGLLNPNPAQGAAYYQAIAGNTKTDLEGWWTANGFTLTGQGGTRASYMNHNDLGFGRDMHCIEPGGGKLACYVTNYGLPDQNIQNADDAMAQNPATRVATVAMEYDPGAGAAAVQFYVYNGGVGTSTRIEFADLDGLGPKPVPHLCMVCHGGDFVDVDPSPIIETFMVEWARFREFDLPSFRYSGGAAWDFPDGATVPTGLDPTAFATLNRMVRDAHDSPATPIADLIDRWYPGNVFGSNVPQEPNPVPPGWTGNAAVYHSVYARSCRTCHIAQDRGNAAINPVFDDASEMQSSDYYVCGSGGLRRMPNAFITYRNFWADTPRVQLYQGFILPPNLSCGA